MQKTLRLRERLAAVAGYIAEGASVADIGTDHGFIPVYLALNGLAKNIIASDVSAGSLAAARRCAVRYGVPDKITFINAPGLDGVRETDADTIVIAGVGGETIIGILENAPWTRRPGVSLVLQPQTKIDLLRGWLIDSGYNVRETRQALERGRNYTIISVSAIDKSQ